MAGDDIAHTAGGNPAGPGPHQRHAGAPLIKPPLALAERLVAGGRGVAGPLPPVGQPLRVIFSLGFRLRGARQVAVHVAAVVRIEDDDRVVEQASGLELVEDPAEALVDAPHHRGHDWIPLRPLGLGLLGELGGVFRLVPPRPVHAVAPELEIEGLRARGLDELHRLGGLAIDDVFAGWAVGDVAHMAAAAGLPVRHDTVGGKIAAGRPGIGRAVKGDVEAVFVGPVFGRQAEVPLADVRGAVAVGPERRGQRGDRRIEIVLAFRQDHGPGWRDLFRHEDVAGRLRREVAGGGENTVAGGIPAGEDAGPRGGAERVGVGVREPHRCRGEGVDPRRLVEGRTVGAAIDPAHVVHEEQDDIGPPGRSRRRLRTGRLYGGDECHDEAWPEPAMRRIHCIAFCL